MQPQCARAVLVLALALALAAPQAGAQMIVADITDVTFGSTVTFTITVPVGGPFGATDQVGVVAAGAACANTVPAGVTLQSPAPVTSAASATAVATFDTPGDYLFCYIQGGVGAGVNLAVQVRGADQLMNAQVHPIETFAAMGLQDLAITGTGLVTGMDQVKLVAENANCDDATVLGPAALEAGMAGATVFQVQNLPFGGTFTVCYQVASATNPSEFRNIGTVDAIAPGGYSPRRVSMGNIAINFAGSAGFLTAGMDQAFITTSAMTCDPANAVVGPVTVTDPNHAVFDTQLSGTLDTPGVAYKVCYQVVALAGNAADYFALREELSVTGATDYNPKAAPGAGDITLTFTGVLLDSTNVGDSMKIVDGDDCLADAAIVEGGIPGTAPWVPANARDPPPPELAITVNIPKSGRFLVCFKSSTSGEYHPMATAGAPDRLVVNGAADYSPTIVPVGHTGDLTFSGVAFDAGDRVAVVHENVGSCTSAQAVSLTWTRQSATRGVAEISNPATLATLGNYRVCFTPTGGSVYEMPTPLVVSTQSISPTEYIAGVETQAVHSTNGIASDPNDEIKFIDEGRGETCGLGFPTHGTIVKQAGFDGRYMVTFDYGGIFRLCHRPGSAAEFGPAADVLVRGARAVSPFLPIVAAVGIPTAFELEGWGLSTLDSFEVIDDSAAPGDCGGDVKLSPQLMHEVVGQESLITTAAATFNIGGSFLVCYRVAGGPPLALDTRLTVKGPNLVTPPAPWNFRVEATLLITGRELSADPATGDRVKLITGTQTCADADAPSPAIASVSAPDPTTNEVTATIPVNTDQGGVYRVCYKPYEGGYVLLPGEHTVNGPVTMTPDTMYANPTRNTVVAITGEGLNPADLIKIIAQGGDCATAPDLFGSQQAVANPAAVPFTLDAAGEYEVCYQLITAMPMVFQRWQQIQVFGVAAVSPTAVDVGYDVQIVIRGTGLNPVTDRVELMPTMTCPVAAPTDGPNLRGDSNTVVHTTALLAGSAATYICYYANNEWTMHATPLVVNGPHTRTMTQPTTPLIAGAPLQFTVAGVGLSGGADAVRWVRRQVTAGAVSPEVCNNPVVPDATVAADSTTPTVQLPGGTYVMCYRLGTSSVFIPVGDPMGGAPGGIQGEVALAGPSGFWTAAGAAFATAQEALLSFDNLVDGAEYKVALCRDGSTSDLTLLSGADPATPVTEVAFTGGAAALYPLQGGTTQVCFKVEGSEWTPLPRIAALPGDRNADLTRPLDPAGEVTIAGPAGVQLPLIDGLQLSLIPAGRAVVFPLVPGAELSTNQSSVWWAPTSEGCTSATFNPTNHSLATTLLINATTLQTVFHAAGEYALCYSARPDAAQVVAQHHLLTVTVHGLSQAASTTVNFGQVAPAELALPRVGGNPPREVFLLPQASAAAPPGARSCNVFDATANTNNPPADAVRAPVLRVAAAAATYDVAAAPPGYHVVCLQQDTAGYATLPELLVVRGPVTLEPDAVIAPGSFRMQLSGPGITDNDMVRMGELVDGVAPDCANAPHEFSLRNLVFIGARYDVPAEHFVCYELNFPGEPKGTLKWVQPIVFRVTDKPATALFRAGVPTEVESGAPFRVEVELHDQFGNVVGGQDAGTFSISADNSPGLPISLDADGLTQPCVDGTAGFTLKLDTQGVHRLLVTFTDSNTGVVLTALSNEIDVKPGSPSKLAISIMPGSELVSGEEFVVSYHVVDQGFNPIGLTGVTTTVRLAPLDESARAGTLTGTTTSVTDMFGNGAFIDLKINTIGAYRLLVSGVPTDGSGPYTADLDVVVVPGDGAALVIDSQWGDGFAIYAGASLPTLEVHAEDVGQNKLYVGRPTPFFISLAVDALAVLPEGAALYDTDPSVCIQTACTEMVDGRTSYLGTVRFSGVWVNRPGTYRLTVTSPTLTAVTNTFVVAQGPASHVRVTNGAQRAVRPGEIFEVSAGIVDLGGNLVQSDGQIQATDYSASGALSGRLTELVDPATLLASFSLNYTEPGTFTVAFKHSRLSLVQAKVAVVVATDGFTLPPEPAAAEDDGLGTWAIVLIVIGVLLFLILVAVLVMWCRGKEREEEDLGKEPAGAQPDWEEDAQQNPNARYYGGYPDHAEPQNPLGELDHYDGMPPQYTNPYDSMRRNGNARIMTPADPMHQLAAPPQQPARVVEEFMDAPAAQHSPGTPPGPGGYPSMGAGGGGGMAYNDPAVGSPSYNVVPAASPQTQSGVAYSHTGGGYYSGAGQYAA